MAKPDPLLAARTNPEAVEELEVLNLGLATFPAEVLACKNLRSLRLAGAMKWDPAAVIPDELCNLTKLESLSVAESCGAFPSRLGELERLVRLALDRCSKLLELPSSIGQLKSLKELRLTHCSGLRHLPDTVSGLVGLETLDVSGQNMRLETVPTGLWKCGRLRVLRLPESVNTLPAGIGALSNLEELAISASALDAIAAELPRLQRLETLSLNGQTALLPKEVGSLSSLKTLQLYGVRLNELPQELGQLKKLESLDVQFNRITSLAWLIEQLPALRKLEFGDTTLPPNEKKAVKALMKLPPEQRAGATSAPRSKKKTPAEKTKAADKAPPPKKLGLVASINATLQLVILDGSLSRLYRGTENAKDDELTGSDWHNTSQALGDKTAVTLPVGGGHALGLDLGLGQGRANVFARDGELLIVETFIDDEDKEELNALASAPRAASAKAMGEVSIESGVLVLTPSTDSCAKVNATAELGRARPCGSEKSGLIVGVKPGRYTLFVEAERNDSRRAHLVPS